MSILSIAIMFLCSVAIAQTPVDSASVATPSVEIVSNLSDDSLPQNDTLVFSIRIITVGKADDYAIADPNPPSVENLTLVGTSQSTRTELGDGEQRNIRQFRFHYSPQSTGSATIKPIRIQYVFVPNGESKTLATVKYEIAVGEPKYPSKIRPFHLVILALIIITLIVIALLIRKKKDQPELPEQPDLALEEKTRIRVKSIKKGYASNPKAIIDGIARTLFDYILEKYGIDGRAIPENMLIEEFEKAGVSGGTLKYLRDALEICYRIRFGGGVIDESDIQKIEIGIAALMSYNEKKRSINESDLNNDA